MALKKEKDQLEQDELENKKPDDAEKPEEGADFEVDDDGNIIDKPKEEGKGKDVPSPQKKDDDTEKRKQNAAFAALRIKNRELEEEVTRLKVPLPEKEEEEKGPGTSNLNDLLVKDPIEVMRRVSQEETEKRLKDERKRRKEEDDARSVKESYNRTLQTSQTEVLKKHPELNSPDSAKSQIFLEVLDRKPEYVKSPFGPKLAMQDMEEIMEERGLLESNTNKAKAEGAREEKVRFERVNATGTPKERSTPKGRTITLTKDQLEFCKENNLDPKVYAQNLAKFNKNVTGVEV